MPCPLPTTGPRRRQCSYVHLGCRGELRWTELPCTPCKQSRILNYRQASTFTVLYSILQKNGSRSTRCPQLGSLGQVSFTTIHRNTLRPTRLPTCLPARQPLYHIIQTDRTTVHEASCRSPETPQAASRLCKSAYCIDATSGAHLVM